MNTRLVFWVLIAFGALWTILNDAETRLRALLGCQDNTRQSGTQLTVKSRKSHAPGGLELPAS
jgi:hypothetical protein